MASGIGFVIYSLSPWYFKANVLRFGVWLLYYMICIQIFIADQTSNLANAASLLWHAYKSLPSPSSEVNWAGFYVLDPSKSNQLILGPFQGKVACQTIAFGRGVCGAAASTKETQYVFNFSHYGNCWWISHYLGPLTGKQASPWCRFIPWAYCVRFWE